MKYTEFITKLVSLVVIIGSLASFQVVANGRAEEAARVKAEQKAAAKAEAERKKAEAKAAADKVAAEDAKKYKDGIYEGIGEGFGGNIKVRVTVTDGEITDIDAYEHNDEDDEYFGMAVALLDHMVEINDPGVDVVSEATFSSQGLIEAVGNALEKAVNQ